MESSVHFIRALSQSSQRELHRKEQLVAKMFVEHRGTWRTNGHEVRRRLDDLVERFRLEGMAPFGKTFRELVIKLLARPEIKRNPTPELAWTMLDFLLIMSSEPVQEIRLNRVTRNRSRLSMIAGIEATEKEQKERKAAIDRPPINPAETEVDWTALLSEDFLEPPEDDSLSVSIFGTLCIHYPYYIILV